MVSVDDFNSVRLVIRLSTFLLLGSIWFGAVMFLRAKKKTTLVYLLFFTVFYIYIYKVLDYTLFQFQSLLAMKYVLPNLILKGAAAGESINLIPLVTLTSEDLRTSLLNVLLMVPFGFGLPFLTNWGVTRIVVAGGLFSIAIEVLQLVTGWIAQITFRIADINDVIFNTAGAAIGYVLYVGFVRVYRRIARNRNMPSQNLDFLTGSVIAQDREFDSSHKGKVSG
ncbi:MAG TPA: VanZ family protein [Longimicrobiales bacterium]